MRLSLLSEDREIAGLLIQKALQLMCQAEQGASESEMESAVESPAP
jgi:hypothetical protein